MSTTDIPIRGATTADAAAIVAIYNQAVRDSTATFDLEPETVAARRLWLESAGTRLCLVAEIDGRLRPTGHPYIIGSECDVLSVPGHEAGILAKVQAMCGQHP